MSTDCPAIDRYPALDALRGAAAFAVLFYHLRNADTLSNASSGWQLFASGYLAVDLFFLISGFVICHAYQSRLLTCMTFREFMIARFIRLQPVMMIATLIGFALSFMQRATGTPGAPGFIAIAGSLPANLLMLPNIFVPWGIFLFNPPAWSLFYELLANALYALGIRYGAARHLRHAWGTSSGLICLIGYIGVIASILIKGNLDHGVILQDWPVAASRICFSFTLGVVLSRLKEHWQRRLPKLPVHWLLLACLSLLLPFPSGAWRMIYDLVFVSLVSPAMVMLSTNATICHSLKGWMSALGLLSYPLYAVHAPVKHVVEHFFPLGSAHLAVASACAAVTVAWLVALADPALRRWLKGRIHQVRAVVQRALSPAHSISDGM